MSAFPEPSVSKGGSGKACNYRLKTTVKINAMGRRWTLTIDVQAVSYLQGLNISMLVSHPCCCQLAVLVLAGSHGGYL